MVCLSKDASIKLQDTKLSSYKGSSDVKRQLFILG